MAIYTEKILNKKTGKQEDKLIDGKKVYYIRTYVKDEFGNSKQITRHNKDWIGRDGLQMAKEEEIRLKSLCHIGSLNELKKDKKITLSELKKMYLKHLKPYIDEDTLKWKENNLSHFCEKDKTKQVETYPNRDVKTIGKKTYQNWQLQMKTKKYKKGKTWNLYSIRFLNKIHNEVCNMIDYGISEGYLTINFARQCEKIGTLKELKMSESKTIYNTINYNEYVMLMDVSKEDLKFNTYFDLEFTRGPRTGEVRAFRCSDYNPEKKQLMVNHTLSKKNVLKPPKTVSSKAPIDLDENLNKKILTLINELKQQNGFNENWYIFGGENPISAHALDSNKNKYFALAGIKKHLRLHDFRHSCATWLHSIGIDITVISKILRHANIGETMKTYTHLFEKDYIKSLELINELKTK